MLRRDFLKTVFTGLGALAVADIGNSTIFDTNKRKPNLIYILVDDLGYGDLGCYGQKKIKTPNIDKLASNGMKLTQHYAGSTVCAPSRCSLMTGLHTGHTPIRGNIMTLPEGQHPLPSSSITVAELLKKAGYKTGCIGKWGLGGPGSTGVPNNQGFDYWFGYLCQLQAHNFYPSHLWRNGKKITYENNESEKRVYSHDLFTDAALDFIDKNKENSFFLYLAYTIPHIALQVPEDSLDEYKGKFPEKPYKHPYKDFYNQLTPNAAYAAMISRMDRDIDRLTKRIAELGLDGDTLVIFTSDNGPEKMAGTDPEFFNSNGPFRGIKRSLYEGGIRVPFIAKWPGKIQPGSTSNHISALWDFLPTACEVAGLKSPDDIDGISYLPTLLGQKQKQKKHEFLYWEFHEGGHTVQAVRMGKYKAVRKDPAGKVELYNLEKDLQEKHNIADKHKNVVKRIVKYMNNTRNESKTWPLK